MATAGVIMFYVGNEELLGNLIVFGHVPQGDKPFHWPPTPLETIFQFTWMTGAFLAIIGFMGASIIVKQHLNTVTSQR